MLPWISKILPLFRYWKTAGVIILSAAFLISFHSARSRGEKLEIAEQTLQEERQKFQSQIKEIEKAVQDEKERQNFRKLQNQKLKMADDHALRDAYERLRQRAKDHGAV